MTYDKLIEKLDDPSFFNKVFYNHKAVKLLRKIFESVVALHEPTHVLFENGQIVKQYCTCGGTEKVEYPCPTIKAIEKVLQ